MHSYRANESNLAHERLDDEVVAIHLGTGVYYALSGVGADVWTLVVSGADVQAVGDAIAKRYDVDGETVRFQVAALVEQLVAEDLLTVAGDGSPDLAELPERFGDYAPPALQRYDDMQNLLLIDPIHQVDDTGWPVRPGESP